MNLMLKNSHHLIGCNHSVAKYCSHLRLSGFNAVNLSQAVTEHKSYYRLCPLVKAVLSKDNPAQKLANRFYYICSLSSNPLETAQLDELGPWYIQNEYGQEKVWILVLIEIVT